MKKNESPVFCAPPCQILVRDYECDLQGIVNNAVYLNYYEHARSLVLAACELSLAGLAQQQIHLIVSHISIQYHRPLFPGQLALIHTSAQARGLMRLIFFHRLLSDNVLCNHAEVTVVATRGGRPQPIDWLTKRLFASFPEDKESS